VAARAAGPLTQIDPRAAHDFARSRRVGTAISAIARWCGHARMRSISDAISRRAFLQRIAALAAPLPKPLPPVSWTCPMHAEVVDDRSGKCPICGMQLVPVRLDLVWSCQLHLDAITDRQPGRCRICGRQLVKVIKALSFTCPVHAKVNQVDPGTCPIDKRPLVAKYSLRPHGDHNPKHGGNFIMAPNNWHVEATHPEASQFRLYVYDDYSRPFIPRGFSARVVNGDSSIPFSRAPGAPYLLARVPQMALPATIAVKARFEPQQPEYRFDFQFYEYSKEPK
jgi:heavy metal-binding protein